MQENNNIEEEIFCLKFEIDALAEVTLKNEAERWIPGFIHDITENDHIERYKLASQLANGKKVLDVACGAGKGSQMLKTIGNAQYVLGCDLDENAIRYANHRHSGESIIFKVENAEKFLSQDKFDLIVSFETIEHLPDYEAFLRSSKRNLKIGGILIISTPISKKSFDDSPNNPYHIQEWGFKEFQNLLGKYFSVEEVYTQLYQNQFYNEKLSEQQSKKNKPATKRIFNYFFKNKNTQNPSGEFRSTWNSKYNHSILEKFSGQFEFKKLGSHYSGYQLLICRKDGE